MRYLYLCSCDDGRYLKIGVSNDPEKRLKEMQTGNPIGLDMTSAYSFEGPLVSDANIGRLEGNLHIILKDYSVGGEWFEGITEHDVDQLINREAKLWDWTVKKYLTLAVGERHFSKVSLSGQLDLFYQWNL